MVSLSTLPLASSDRRASRVAHAGGREGAAMLVRARGARCIGIRVAPATNPARSRASRGTTACKVGRVCVWEPLATRARAALVAARACERAGEEVIALGVRRATCRFGATRCHHTVRALWRAAQQSTARRDLARGLCVRLDARDLPARDDEHEEGAGDDDAHHGGTSGDVHCAAPFRRHRCW